MSSFHSFNLGSDDEGAPDLSEMFESREEYDQEVSKNLDDANENIQAGIDEVRTQLRRGNLPPPFNQMSLDVLRAAVTSDELRLCAVDKDDTDEMLDVTRVFVEEVLAYITRVEANPMERFVDSSDDLFGDIFDVRRSGVLNAEKIARLPRVPETDEAKMPALAQQYMRFFRSRSNHRCSAPHDKKELSSYESGAFRTIVEMKDGYLFDATAVYIEHLKAEFAQKKEKKFRSKKNTTTEPTEISAPSPSSLAMFDDILANYSPDHLS